MRSIASYFLIYFLAGILSLPLEAQRGGRFFNSDHEGIFGVHQQKVLDSAGNVMFSAKGKIIFKGNSTDNADILFLLKTKDIFSRKVSYLYDRKMDDVQYSLRQGNLFAGSEVQKDRLILSVTKEDGRYTFRAGPKQKKVGYGLGEISEIELVGVMLAFTQRPEVQNEVPEIADRKELIPKEGIVGIIKPAWETNFYREWSWNGRKLEPRWGHRPEDEWIFDGKELRPYWGANVNFGFTWDGEVLRPTWGDDPDYTFHYDGYTLKPYWSDDPEHSWVIDDDVVRPKWDNNPDREYQIEGEVPVPAIAIVVLGIADRN